MIRAMILMALLAGCGTVATPEPTVSPTPTETAVPTPTASPTPTATPEPTPDEAADTACDAISEFRDIGNLLVPMGDAAFDAFSGEGYGTWESAVNGVTDQMETVITLLEDVPNEEPYEDWKLGALQLMLVWSNAIIAYDRGITEQDLSGMEEANQILADGEPLIAEMNAAADQFEADC